MRATRGMSVGVLIALLIIGSAFPALAQDDAAELCDEYPIGECLDEVDEDDEGDTGTPDEGTSSDDDVQEVVLTRDTPASGEAEREQAQVLGMTLPFTGTNLVLMLIAGGVLLLSGVAALVLMRRRGATPA
jgi:LPXTG-motif cell wall-anchored protein